MRFAFLRVRVLVDAPAVKSAAYTALAGGSSVSLSWTEPDSSDSGPITGYVYVNVSVSVSVSVNLNLKVNVNVYGYVYGILSIQSRCITLLLRTQKEMFSSVLKAVAVLARALAEARARVSLLSCE